MNSIVSLNVPSSNGVSCGLYAEEGLQNSSQTGLHIPSTNSLVTVDITVEWSAYGNICAGDSSTLMLIFTITILYYSSYNGTTMSAITCKTVLIMELPCHLPPVKLFYNGTTMSVTTCKTVFYNGTTMSISLLIVFLWWNCNVSYLLQSAFMMEYNVSFVFSSNAL